MAKKKSTKSSSELLQDKLSKYEKQIKSGQTSSGYNSSEFGERAHARYENQQIQTGRASLKGALQMDGYYMPTLQRGIDNNDKAIMDVAERLAKNSSNGKWHETATVKGGTIDNGKVSFDFTIPKTAEEQASWKAPVIAKRNNQTDEEKIRIMMQDAARNPLDKGKQIATDRIYNNYADKKYREMLASDTEMARLKKKNQAAYDEVNNALAYKRNMYSDLNIQAGMDPDTENQSEETIISNILKRHGISDEEARLYAKNWNLYEKYDELGYAYDTSHANSKPLTIDEQTKMSNDAFSKIDPEQKVIIDRLFEESNKYHDRTEKGANVSDQRAVNLAKNKLIENGMNEEKASWYAENWEYMNQLINGAPYRTDRQAALDKYGDEAYSLALDVLNERGNKNPFNLLNKDFKDKTSADYANLQAIAGEDTEKILQYVQEMEDEKATYNRDLRFQEILGEHPRLAGVAGTAIADAGEVVSGLAAMGEFTRATGYADKNAPVNVYSDRYALKNLDRGIQSAVTERIGLDSMIAGDSEFTTKTKQALYGMTNSTITSGLSIAIGGALGKVLGTSSAAASQIAEAVTLTEFSANAFASTYQEQIEKGTDHKDALRTATISAVAEAFFERYSLESLQGMYFARKAGETGFKRTIAQLLSQGLVEGSEEVFTDLANYYGDYLINGGFSEYSQLVRENEMNGMSHEEAVMDATFKIAKKIGVSGISGVFSGLLLGTGTTVASAVNVSNAAHTIVDTPELSAVKDNILETARQQAENTTARKVVDELDASNKEATAGDIAKIIESEISIGQEEQSIDEFVAEIVNAVEGLSEEEKTDAVDTIMNSLNTESENVTEEQEQKLTETLDKDEKLSDAYAKAVTGEYAPASNTVNTAMSAAKAVQESNKAKAKLESSFESGKNKGLAAVKVDDKTGTVSKILKDGQIETYVKGKGFLTRKIESVMYASSNVSQVHNALSYDSVINADHATTLAAQYKSGIPAQTWLEGVRAAYLEGASNTGTIESLLDNGRNAFVSVLPQETLAMAYALGKEYANSQTKSEVKAPAKRLKQGRLLNKTGELEGKVDERTQMLAEAIAMITGNNIQFVDAMVNGSDGEYNSSTRTITISLEHLNTAGQLKATDILKVLGHEALGEYFEKVNPKGYDEVRKATIDLLEKVEGSSRTNATIKSIMEAYQKTVESGKTLEEASGELANNLIAEIMFSEEGAKDIADIINEFSPEERQSIFQKFINLINSLIDDIKSLFEGRNTGISAVAEVEDLERVRDLFKREFVKGVRNDIENMNAQETYDAAIEEAGKETKSFSADTNFEQTDKLLAVHNLTEEQLIESLKLGGFPSPSIAIIKQGMGHTNYGPISVLFNKESIDPSNPLNYVYGADAYTPSVEGVAYELKRKEFDAFNDELRELGESADKYFTYGDMYQILGAFGSDVAITKNQDDAFEQYKRSTSLKAAYLEKIGKHIEAVRVEKPKGYDVDKVDIYKNIIDHYGEEAIREYGWYRGKITEQNQWFERYGSKFIDDIVKETTDYVEGVSKPILLRMRKSGLLLDALDYIKEGEGPAEIVVDLRATDDAVNEAIKPYEKEYETWLRNNINSFYGKKGIHNGKSYITDSGNRRTFKQLYHEWTAENIVRAMYSSQDTIGQNANPRVAEGLQSVVSERYKSLDDIRRDSVRLQKIEEDEYKEIMSSMTDKIGRLSRELDKLDPNKSPYYFNNLVDDSLTVAAKGTKTIAAVKKAFSANGITLNNEMAGRVLDLFDEVANLPTMYFEAKPHRVLYNSEIARVIIPDNSSDKLIDLLNQNMVDYEMYKTDADEERTAIMNDTRSRNISFDVDYETVSKITSDDKYEVIKDNDYKYLSINIDLSIFRNEDKAILKRIVRQILNNRYRNTIVGYKDRSPVVSTDRAVKEIAYSERRGSQEDIVPKLVTVSGMDNIMDACIFTDHVSYEEVKERHPEAVNGIDHYMLVVNINNQWFTGRVSVTNCKNVRVLYSITKIRGIGKNEIPSKIASLISETNASREFITQIYGKYNTDSENNSLEDNQLNYFMKSKNRDGNGNLTLMYHGTPTGGFSVFKSRSGIFYATANKEYAARYMNPSASSIRGYAVEATNPMIYEGYLNVTKPFDILNDPEAKRIFVEEYIKGGNAAGINPYISDAEINKIIKNGIDWTEADNLKEFFDDNEYDYDGIILNEGADGGYGNEVASRGTSVAFFKSNQFKAKENKNPTKSEDIYRSIDYKIDEDAIEIFMDNDNSSSFLNADTEVGKVSTRAISIIEEGMKSASKLNIEVDDKLVSKIAKNILKENSSKFEKATLESNLKNVFAYVKDRGGKVSYEDLMAVMDEIARPVLEMATANTGEGFEDRQHIMDYLKGAKLKLNPEQMQEVKNVYGSYNTFRAQQGLMGVWSNSGTYIDEVWDEICDAAGGSLDIATVPQEQPTALLATLEALKGKEVGLLSGQSLDQAARDLSIDIFRQFFELQSGENIQANKTLRQAYTQTYLELRKTQAELQKAYAKDSAKSKQQAMEDAAAVNRAQSLENVIMELDNDIDIAVNQYGDMYLAEELKAQKKVYEERIKKLKSENKAVREKLEDVKLRNRNTRTQEMYNRRNKEIKKKIQKNMDYLNSLLSNETEKKHVPVDMVSQVVDICKLVTPEQTNSKLLQQKLDRLNNMYNQYKSDGTFMQANTGGFNGEATSYIDYDRNLSDKIQRLARVLGDKKYTQLLSAELVEVLDITNAIRTQIRNANKLIANKRLTDAREASRTMMDEVVASGGKADGVNHALDRYFTGHLNSYREFRKLSGYKDDGALMALWEQFDEGQLTAHQIEKEVDDIFNDVLDGKENQKMVKRLTSTKDEDMVDIGIKDAEGKPVLVTRAMRLSLIMHTYNGSNRAHLLGDGITLPNMKLYKAGKMSEAYSRGTTYRLVDYTAYKQATEIEDKAQRDAALEQLMNKAAAQLKTLETQLDDYEKAFLADAKEMFWKYTGKKINQTSVKLNGYAKARVENYFPIKVDSNFVAQDFAALIMDGTIEGMGMLKNRVTSKKAILLEDITNVILRQTSNVAKYAGFAIPIRNINMVMNMTYKDNNGNPHNLRKTITEKWGESNTKYLQNLMQDIQGGRHEDMALFSAMRGNFAGATLNLNLVVAAKQAASMPTAAAVTGWGPLLKAQKDIGKAFFKKEGIEELEAINPLLWYRNKGNSTQELGDIRAKKGFGEKLTSIGMLNWIQNMDSGTVRTLEYAAKYYVDDMIKKGADGYKNLTEGSVTYWSKVSDIFTKTVEETQPNYTVLQQAAISRTEHSLTKALFMFKTQPLQNFGIMYDALGELNAKTKQYSKLKNEQTKAELDDAVGKFRRAVSSQFVAALVYSLMDVLGKAIILNRFWKYKDDDDKDNDGKTNDILWSEIWKDIFVNGIPNTLIGGFIGGSETLSAAKSFITKETYYGIEVPVVEMVNGFVDNLKKVREYSDKLAEAETTADIEKFTRKRNASMLALVSSTAQFLGIPFTNVKNMVDSVYRYTEGIIAGETFTEMGPEDELTQKQMIMQALIKGDMKEYERLLEETRKEETGKTMNITNEVKKAYLSGEVSEDKAIDYIIDNMSSIEDEQGARLKLEEWKYESEHPGESYDANAKTSDLQQYLGNKDFKSAKTEIKALQDKGISDDSIKKGIKNACFDEYQKLKKAKKSANYVNELAKLMAQAGLYKDVKSATTAIKNNWLTDEEKAKQEAEKAKKKK